MIKISQMWDFFLTKAINFAIIYASGENMNKDYFS